MRQLLDDCFLTDKDRLRHDEALALIKERLHVVCKIEEHPLGVAAGRILAQELVAENPVPAHDNAAVDGFAFKHRDYLEQDGRLRLVGRIAAGNTQDMRLQAGEAVQIFTGARMPKDADTVAMLEDCKPGGEWVTVPQGLKAGANRRKAGEDVKAGDEIFNPGTRLNPPAMARLASLGSRQVAVYAPLRVALFSTGDEIRDTEQADSLQSGQLYDVNRPMLKAAMSSLPVMVHDFGIVSDNREKLAQTLKLAAQQNDLILTSGGVSRGGEDHMVSLLDDLGKRHLWQIAIKPGRPMTFGQIDNAVFIGLPGNPVAVYVWFLLYARQVILRLAGANWQQPPRFQLPADFEIIHKKNDRREFLRGHLQYNEQGKLLVDKYPRDGSGLIHSLTESDGLIELPEDVSHIAKGDLVSFIPYSAFG